MHSRIISAMRAGGTGSKRDQLQAVHGLQKYLQSTDHPEKRTATLGAVIRRLFPHGPQEMVKDIGDIIPEGMTQYDLWELCQHQWAYWTESSPDWLTPCGSQVINSRQHGKFLCVNDDHPLTILLQWSLALHRGSAKLRDALTLKRWHERASSLPEDHNVWQFTEPCNLGEEGVEPAGVQGHLSMFGPGSECSLSPLHIKWTIGHDTARSMIQKLRLLSRCELPSLMYMLLHEAADSSQVPSTHDDDRAASHCKDPAEASAQQVFTELFPEGSSCFSQQQEADMAYSCEAANPGMLQAQPAQWVRHLLVRCGFRGDGRAARMALQAPGPHAQAASPPDTANAHGPTGPPARSACNSGDSHAQAEAVAQALILEETTAKAKAQAQKDAQISRRSRKSAKAISRPKSPAGSRTDAAEGQAKQPSNEAPGASVPSPANGSSVAPQQHLPSPLDSSRRPTATNPERSATIPKRSPSQMDATLDVSSSSGPAVASLMTADHPAASNQLGPLRQGLSAAAQPSSADPRGVALLAKCGADSQLADASQGQARQNALSPDTASTDGAASSGGPSEARPPPGGVFQASQPDSNPEQSSAISAPEQHADVTSDAASTASPGPWERTRNGKPRLKDPGRFRSFKTANASRPQSPCPSPQIPNQIPESGSQPALVQKFCKEAAEAAPAASSGRCQPKARSRDIESSAQVSRESSFTMQLLSAETLVDMLWTSSRLTL